VGILVDGPPGSRVDSLPDKKFFDSVQQKVQKALKEKNINKKMYEYIGIVEAVVTLSLYLLATYHTSVHGSYLWCIFLGVITGRMGFLMHSGNHCAASGSVLGNRLIGMFMDLIGSSWIIWGYEHQVAHHMDPNEYKRDNDCEIGSPYVRMHPEIEHNEYHPWQHITVPVGMTVGFLKWYLSDLGHFLKGKVGNVTFAITGEDWTTLIIAKFQWAFLHWLIPLYYFGPVYASFSCFLFMAVGGHYLENTFIVNHIQHDHVPPPDCHWSVKQVLATSNWGSGSVLWNWVSGGLNHQIEHHLFPTMPIYMYPHISDAVRKTCEEFKLPYHNYLTFREAWWDMIGYLRTLGQPGNDGKKKIQ
jgi:linoleoyl-CoA desaturase